MYSFYFVFLMLDFTDYFFEIALRGVLEKCIFISFTLGSFLSTVHLGFAVVF